MITWLRQNTWIELFTSEQFTCIDQSMNSQSRFNTAAPVRGLTAVSLFAWLHNGRLLFASTLLLFLIVWASFLTGPTVHSSHTSHWTSNPASLEMFAADCSAGKAERAEYYLSRMTQRFVCFTPWGCYQWDSWLFLVEATSGGDRLCKCLDCFVKLWLITINGMKIMFHHTAEWLQYEVYTVSCSIEVSGWPYPSLHCSLRLRYWGLHIFHLISIYYVFWLRERE